MRDIKGIFPGVFTMGNMFCGFLAIISCVRGADPTEPAWLILLAFLLDSLDGKVARISKTSSAFGVELDSLADLVSFAVAPAVVLYSYKLITFGQWGWMLGFIYIMAAAFRLARFNLQADMEEKKNFIGLPVPAAATAIASYIIFTQHIWGELRLEKFVITMLIILSILMVSNIEYESNPKFSTRSKGGLLKLSIFVISILAIIYKPRYAIFPVTLLYILSGLVRDGLLLIKQGQIPSPKKRTPKPNRRKPRKNSNTKDNKEYKNDGKNIHFPEKRRSRPSGTDDKTSAQ